MKPVTIASLLLASVLSVSIAQALVGGQSSEIPAASCDVTGGGISLAGGSFLIGSDQHYHDEAPVFRLNVEPFEIDRHEVTNAQFRQFIEETGYLTTAERAAELGFPSNGSAVFTNLMAWSFVEDANWKQPEGPGSTITGRDNDPVVQVSLEDAKAYAQWAGRSLPTEAQWEFAARGGLEGKAFAWGDVFTPGGEYMANTWQGPFSLMDSGEDGHKGRAAVGCYRPNGYGLYDMIGNVWEWTGDPYYPDKRFSPPAGVASTGFDPKQPAIPVGVIKGGSFLCTPDFCGRFRPAARHAQDTGLGTNHIGFRTVSR